MVVILPESGGDMDNARAVVGGDIIGAGHEKRFFMSFGLHKGHELIVFDIFQFFSLHLGDDFVIFPEKLIRKHLGADENIAVAFGLDIVGVGAHAKRHVGR